MKKLAEIPCQLLEKDASSALKLDEQPYIILIPKSVLIAAGLASNTFTFELIVKDGKLSLIGPSVPGSQGVTQPGFEEIVK